MFGWGKLVARIAALEKERDEWKEVARLQLEVSHQHAAEVKRLNELRQKVAAHLAAEIEEAHATRAMMEAYDKSIPGWRKVLQ